MSESLDDAVRNVFGARTFEQGDAELEPARDLGDLFRFVVHNLIAHPLLVLCPPLGRFLHDITIP